MQMIRSMLAGAIGFSLVSTAAFALWAFGGRWFQTHGGETSMYAGCCLVFVLLSGLILRPLLAWRATIGRFYGLFMAAFVGYALAWCAGWFWLGAGAGEWLGSFLGSVAFTAILAGCLRGWHAFLPATLVTFSGHSAGYFVGEYFCYTFLHSTVSELAWGLLYGLGFGAGMGFAFAAMSGSGPAKSR